jgi:GDP-D-mannose dehydratase
MRRPVESRTAIVTGATGQDGYYLVQRLLADGWTVHAAVRDVEAAEMMFGDHHNLVAVRRDIRDPGPLRALVGDVRPEELYNLAGESSVGASFADPQATWESKYGSTARARASTRPPRARCSAPSRARASSTTRPPR